MTNNSIPPSPPTGLARRAVGSIASLPFWRRALRLWDQNQHNLNLPLSKWDKLGVGVYLILRDYADGRFPPTFQDQQRLYLSEMNYRHDAPGTTAEEVAQGEMAKPFWFGHAMRGCFQGFLKLTESLELAQVRPPSKLLELGGGAGWTAEFLAQLGYHVVSTTISPDDVATGQKRVEALKVKGLPAALRFVAAPMESVADHVKEDCPFDTVFVLAALHHAFDWRAAIVSAYACLKPGGWMLICQEPNVLHTAISYRVARLSNSHEIGFSRTELVAHLRHTNFQKVISVGKRLHCFYYAHWLLAQK